MEKEYYAHTSSNQENEKLIDHLHLTAKLAAENGLAFNSEKVCEQLGLLHDIGKRTESFQGVLNGFKTRQDHAIVAALYYYSHGLCTSKWLKRRLSLIMAAHHSSLYTYHMNEKTTEYKPQRLMSHEIRTEFAESRINNEYERYTADASKELTVKDENEYEEIKKYIDDNQLLIPLTSDDYPNIKEMTYNERMLYVRMLSSCLVDADYSATIEYENPGYIDTYFHDNRFNADVFLEKMENYHNKLINNAKNTPMNRLRNEVYESCIKAGKLKTGFLTLTAPTGTGKTLALMEFALQQAKAFNKNRIIVVLPYLSIIDQNGCIYKDIFGDDVVLIDDSQTDYNDETRVYSDRWSSPIIVTTSVNFFQTLFSSKTTKLRKLHNVCNSVVIFDECQTLPTEVLNTTIEALQSLTKLYNSTVLFSTATRPSYDYRNYEYYLDSKAKSDQAKKRIMIASMKWKAEEIMKDVQGAFEQYDKIKNTETICITNRDMTYEELIDYYCHENAALYIFNTVKHAVDMYNATVSVYGEEGCYIITSRFCSADKLRIIENVNKRLASGEFVRLIATQCIEAGVDFDFPCGAREYAPLDSVIQSAGRINRNGKYNGKFLVFRLPDHSNHDFPSNSYKEAADITRLIAIDKNGLKLNDLKLMDEYFRELYTKSLNYNRDSEELLASIAYDSYDDVSREYKIIDSVDQIILLVRPLFADTAEFDNYISRIEEDHFVISKGLMKKLSKYTVSLYRNKDMKLSDFGIQLNIRIKRSEKPINWILVNNPAFYTRTGFDTKADTTGGVVL